MLIVLEEDGIRAAATPQTKTKDCFILRTASLSSLYNELNLNEFQQIILSTMIQLYVLLLSTVWMNDVLCTYKCQTFPDELLWKIRPI